MILPWKRAAAAAPGQRCAEEIEIVVGVGELDLQESGCGRRASGYMVAFSLAGARKDVSMAEGDGGRDQVFCCVYTFAVFFEVD